MTSKELASAIHSILGAEEHLNRIYHCMTRLRLVFDQEDSAADTERRKKLEALDGVIGTHSDGPELQIILGPGKAANVYDAFCALRQTEAAPKTAGESKPPFDGGRALHEKIRARNATPVKQFFRRIAGIFIPLIPAFIACGLISGILNVTLKTWPEMTASFWIQLAGIAGNVIFWSMNLFVGAQAAKAFGGTPILGGILGGLLSHPGLASVAMDGMAFTPGRGGVISVLLVAAFGAWLEQRLRRIIPEIFSLFLTPLLTFLIAGTFALLLIQPAGGLLSDLIGSSATAAVQHGGAITGFILGGAWLPMVMLGIHQTFTPIHAELLSRYGVTILLPILAMAGAGQVGASLAVYCRTKNAQLRKTISSALPVGILGVGEPLIYGVTLPLGRPFLAACIGGAFGGAVQAAFGVGAATLGISGLPLAAGTDHIAIYLLGLLTAYTAGFLACWIISFDDPPEA